jgi:CRP/FNR family transcriptional regulator, cyclic AMP receptor protein
MRRSVSQHWPAATLLGGLAAPTRAALLSVGTEVEQAANRPLIRQGDRHGHTYLLLDGLVKVRLRDTNGKEALLGIRIGGDLVGEMAALEGSERSADVVPCGPLVARVIKREQLLELMNRHGDLAIEIAKMISQRLRWAGRRRLEFTAQAPRIRVARVLTEVVDGYGRRSGNVWELGVPLTQSEIAQLVGVKLRTMEKELQVLETERVLRRQYRGLEVLDLGRLRAIGSS